MDNRRHSPPRYPRSEVGGSHLSASSRSNHSTAGQGDETSYNTRTTASGHLFPRQTESSSYREDSERFTGPTRTWSSQDSAIVSTGLTDDSKFPGAGQVLGNARRQYSSVSPNNSRESYPKTKALRNPFDLELDIDATIASNLQKLNEERRRGRPNLRNMNTSSYEFSTKSSCSRTANHSHASTAPLTNEQNDRNCEFPINRVSPTDPSRIDESTHSVRSKSNGSSRGRDSYYGKKSVHGIEEHKYDHENNNTLKFTVDESMRKINAGSSSSSHRETCYDVQHSSSNAAAYSQSYLSSKQDVSIGRDKQKTLDLTYLEEMGLKDRPLWPTYGFSKCSNCSKYINKLEGIVLKECKKHRLCKPCLRSRISRLEYSCPVNDCHAVITAEEIEALRTMTLDEAESGTVPNPKAHMDDRSEQKSTYESQKHTNSSRTFVPEEGGATDFQVERSQTSKRNLLVNHINDECGLCGKFVKTYEGYVFEKCQAHTICYLCVCSSIRDAQGIDVRCPAKYCQAQILPEEIEELESLYGLIKKYQKGQKDDDKGWTMIARCTKWLNKDNNNNPSSSKKYGEKKSKKGGP